MQQSAAYISCACNRLPHAADWGNNELIIYASNHAVVVYGHGRALATLHEHSNRVNVVRWIRPSWPKPETEFISAATDGKVVIWSRQDSFATTSVINFEDAVNLCDAVYLDEDSLSLLICSGTANGAFNISKRNESGQIESLQNLNFLNKFPIEARLVKLPDSVVLAIAIEDYSIELFSSRESDKKKPREFLKVQKLTGHQNWITSIDWTVCDSGDVMLASASQDNFIRLWKIGRKSIEATDSKDLKTKKKVFPAGDSEYEIILESVLGGHENWVYEVHWHPKIKENNKYLQPMKLLSCSLDKTAIIWEPREADGVWSESIRVGEVGGGLLGFYGCRFAPKEESFFTYGYHGSFHMWKLDEETKNWELEIAPGGHFDAVVDLCWDPKGRFLMSASLDQTTRIHAPWQSSDTQETWHEISRPQVHGHDMSCLALLKPCLFASGAEEKIVRIFTAPLIFHEYMQKIWGQDWDAVDPKLTSIAKKASVPSLGLTNKAVTDDEFLVELRNPVERPPVEEELIRDTLWPEQQKLYGHGYEIFCLAARHDGSFLASASKTVSPNSKHAAIILWDTQKWAQVQMLQAHRQTITQLAFSPDDQNLLSVSRDRRWALFVWHQEGRYDLAYLSPEKGCLHTRIIWCCAWSGNSKYFATGSRDGSLGIWCRDSNFQEKQMPVAKLSAKNASVTALAFAPCQMVLAVGYESGIIEVQKINEVNFEWSRMLVLNTSLAHHLTVRKLMFRPGQKRKNYLELASCGLDGVLKIHQVPTS